MHLGGAADIVLSLLFAAELSPGPALLARQFAHSDVPLLDIDCIAAKGVKPLVERINLHLFWTERTAARTRGRVLPLRLFGVRGTGHAKIDGYRFGIVRR
jgi:hypothetical protein